jgi:hypothetical protein
VNFRLPQFPLTCNLWRWGNAYTGAPDVVVKGNLTVRDYGGVRSFVRNTNAGATPALGFTEEITCVTLLLPARTDVRWGPPTGPAGNQPDLVEVPAGSGRCYIVLYADDSGKGFPNEHRWAEITALAFSMAALSGNPWTAPLWPFPTP